VYPTTSNVRNDMSKLSVPERELKQEGNPRDMDHDMDG
jgi:hypothetical protein